MYGGASAEICRIFLKLSYRFSKEAIGLLRRTFDISEYKKI